VRPDILLPSPIDTSEFGESTRENALPWDKISATAFQPSTDQLEDKLPKLKKAHQRRISASPEYQLFLKDIEATRKRHSRKTVSLNLETRRAKRDEMEAEHLDEANAWRKIKGKKPVKSLEALPDDTDHPDVLLNEAAQMAADMSRMELDIQDQ